MEQKPTLTYVLFTGMTVREAQDIALRGHVHDGGVAYTEDEVNWIGYLVDPDDCSLRRIVSFHETLSGTILPHS
jgi:hypothetical protein